MERGQPITITLPAEQWNLVLQILSEAQYRIAAPLISAIEQQARTQDGGAETHTAAEALRAPAKPRGNGKVAAES